MTYFKSLGYDTVKLLLNQVAMLIFGFCTQAATASNDTLLVLSSILGAGLYYFLIHNMMWTMGGRDRIRVDAGRAQRDLCKPLYMGLLANIPNFITAAVCIISYFINASGGTYLISNVLLRLLQSFYIGITVGLNITDNPFTFAVLPFLAVFVTYLSYLLGYNNLSLLPKSKKSIQQLKK